MKLKTIKKDKDMLQVELEEETHTFANVLRDELYEDDKVKSAAYIMEHPLTSNPRIVVRTKGETPTKALKDAASRIERKAKEFGDKFKKAK